MLPLVMFMFLSGNLLLRHTSPVDISEELQRNSMSNNSSSFKLPPLLIAQEEKLLNTYKGLDSNLVKQEKQHIKRDEPKLKLIAELNLHVQPKEPLKESQRESQDEGQKKPADEKEQEVKKKPEVKNQSMAKLKEKEGPVSIDKLLPKEGKLNATERFKFIYSKDRLGTNGPKVNPIPEGTTWRHDLGHLEICNATDPFILAIVISAVPKKDLREYIRRTWANPRLYPYTRIRSIFIVGATTNAQLQSELDKENSKYSDIIQYNYIDSYANLTYKSLAMLTWIGKHCPQAQFIAKIDDDVMVNPFHLRTYFEERMKNPPVPAKKDSVFYIHDALQPGENVATTYIYGRYDSDPYPLRYTKWAVSMEEYPEKNFPPFVHGPAYVMGRVAARLMLKYAPYVPFLKLEDVYMTGLVAHAAQVKHVQINVVINTFKASDKLYNGTQAFMEETSPKSRQEAWEGISLHAPVDIKALGTPWT